MVAVVAATLPSCGLLTGADSPPPPWSSVGQLLVDEPTLPSTLIWTIPPVGTAPGPERLKYTVPEPDVRIVVPWECPEPGRAMAREWFRDGVSLKLPHVRQAVCAFGAETSAQEAYGSDALEDIYAEPLSNFEDPAEAAAKGWAIRPSATPPALSASEFDIACNGGDANGVCNFWLFRARYGSAITVVSIFSQGGGIRYEEFEELIISVDHHLAESSIGPGT